MRALMKRKFVLFIKCSLLSGNAPGTCPRRRGRRLAIFHDSEAFFIPRVFVCAVFGAAGFHPFEECIGVADLRFVLEKCFELDGPCFGPGGCHPSITRSRSLE